MSNIQYVVKVPVGFYLGKDQSFASTMDTAKRFLSWRTARTEAARYQGRVIPVAVYNTAVVEAPKWVRDRCDAFTAVAQ